MHRLRPASIFYNMPRNPASSCLRSWIATAILALCAWLVLAIPVRGDTYNETFEDEVTSWREAAADVKYRVESHLRSDRASHSGKRCEQFGISAAAGSYVQICRDLPPALVVDEFVPRVWVKADRPGVQVIVRVVLPRVRDEAGKPRTLLIRGEMVTQVDTWQQLSIADFNKQLAAQIRVLRAQVGPKVDPRECYVDQLLLNIYGGPGATNVLIDDLEIDGYVPRVANIAEPVADGRTIVDANVRPAAATMPAGVQPYVGSTATSTGATGRDVRLNGSLLQVDGRPFFPRAVQYQGEALDFLQGMGFNAVQVGEAPDARFFAEAARLNLWIICPPPRMQEVPAGDGSIAISPLPEYFEGVLAWNVGQGLTSRELEATAAIIKKLRIADARRARPIIGAADAELRAYSRQFDLMLTSRFPLGTSLELTDYGTWLRERPRLTRPGTPLWTVVQTQLSPRLYEQLAVFAPGAPPEAMVDEEAVRLLTRTVVAAGTRGIIFESQSRLDASDAVTKSRATLAELMNIELDLIEPWSAAGNALTSSTTSDPLLTAAVLQIDRAKLLLPLRTTAGCQQVPRQSAGGAVTFVAPGVGEATDVYELSYTGFRPLRHKRVAGGVAVTIDDFTLGTMVVVTSDPMVINTLTKRTARVAQRAVELQHELAARSLLVTEEIDRRMPASAHVVPFAGAAGKAPGVTAPNDLATARAHLAEADKLLLAGDRRAGSVALQKLLQSTGNLKRDYWARAINPTGSTVSNPFAVSFATLPQHFLFAEAVKNARTSENLLPSGNFESLDVMVDSGWRHFQHPQPNVKTQVELSPKFVTGGQFSLHLRAKASDEAAAGGLVETPPIWITSAPINLQAGSIVCIRGQARVAKPITGNVDGLTILDSFTGEALAERIGQTTAWKEFVLYRAAPADGPLTLTFALSGLGDAYLDDVSVRLVERPIIPRLDRPTPSPGVTPAGFNR